MLAATAVLGMLLVLLSCCAVRLCVLNKCQCFSKPALPRPVRPVPPAPQRQVETSCDRKKQQQQQQQQPHGRHDEQVEEVVLVSLGRLAKHDVLVPGRKRVVEHVRLRADTHVARVAKPAVRASVVEAGGGCRRHRRRDQPQEQVLAQQDREEVPHKHQHQVHRVEGRRTHAPRARQRHRHQLRPARRVGAGVPPQQGQHLVQSHRIHQAPRAEKRPLAQRGPDPAGKPQLQLQAAEQPAQRPDRGHQQPA